MIRIIIVEDEYAAAERLKDLLLSISNKITIIKMIDSVAECVEYFSSGPEYDLIMMDIHLADGISFEIFQYVTISKPIIFTTAYDTYAIDAFKQYAIDYLLKPIKKELLQQAINKYDHYYREKLPDYLNLIPDTKQDKKWMIKLGTQINLINHNDVAFYFTSEKVTFLQTFDGKKYPIDSSLDQIELNIIDPEYFRINRQYIIHQNAISKMQTHTKSRVRIQLLPNEEEVIVSAERSPKFKKWLTT